MTTIKFQADADLKQAIVTGTIRRQPNIDFKSANAAGLEGKKDPEVLAIAAQEGRILVTHDRKTMPAEFGQFICHKLVLELRSFLKVYRLMKQLKQ